VTHHRPNSWRWHRAVILLGVVYVVIGLTFGSLAGWASSSQMRVTWRLLAWLMSAIAFAAHIWYEQFRLRSARVPTGFHAALGVALGALLVAGAAVFHGQATAATHQNRRVISLVLWPILAGVPAFLVALAAAAALALRRRGPT
jgi:hypothetical protein